MLWFVGKVFSEFQAYLEAHNLAYGLFADSAHKHHKLRPAQRVDIDFSSLAGIEEQLADIDPRDVDAVAVAGYENYVLAAAVIARHFGVPGPSIEAARAATDKIVMRERFHAYDPELTPDFAEVTDWPGIERFLAGHGFPVMLKPASLMKSLLITKNSTRADLRRNFEKLSADASRLYAKYGIPEKPRFIIEEFLVGSMHTVAAFADTEGAPIIIPGIVDCITGQDMGFDDNFLYSRSLPTRLTSKQTNQLYEASADGIRALGLTSCPAHVELILTDKGPKIIEIGARIGGYRPRLYEYASGYDLRRFMIATAYGRSIQIPQSIHRSAAALELFPDGQGAFAGLTNRAEIDKLPSLLHLSAKPLPGRLIGRSSDGYKAAAVIILGNEDPVQFQKDFDYVRTHAQIEIIAGE